MKAIKKTHKADVPVKKRRGLVHEMKSNWQLYVMVLLPLIYIIVFKYIPMYGARMAFLDYIPVKGYFGSEWVGFKHFLRFFNSPVFGKVIKNTLIISFYTLAVGIPFPIILAVCLNYLKNQKFKKVVQMVTYMPHFISTVIIVGLIQLVFNMQTGIVNTIIDFLGGEKINFLSKPEYFRHLYVWSGVWQSTGWNSIMYISALAGVDPQLHEAAIMDGASKVKRIWHIDIPSITPTIAIMVINAVGGVLSVSFDKIYLMQNPTNINVSEVLSTYEYEVGLGGGLPSYSYSAAIGLFATVVNFVMICIANRTSKKLADTGLW